MTTEAAEKRPHVGLFVTCLVDFFRPSVGFAAIKLLEEAGATVVVPESQTCCGQPAYNSGDRADAEAIARAVIETFERFEMWWRRRGPAPGCSSCITLPCWRTIRHSPREQARSRPRATSSQASSSRCSGGTRSMRAFRLVTYHDFCSSLRELKIHDAPRRLLKSVDGLDLTEMEETEVCCGLAAPSRSNIPTSPMPSSKRRFAISPSLARPACSPEISVASCISLANCPATAQASSAGTSPRFLPG